MSLQSISRSLIAVGIIIALGLAGASCKPASPDNGEGVACETDADCEHLTYAVFECKVRAEVVHGCAKTACVFGV